MGPDLLVSLYDVGYDRCTKHFFLSNIYFVMFFEILTIWSLGVTLDFISDLSMGVMCFPHIPAIIG